MDNNTNRNNPKNDRDNKNQKKNQIIGIVVALVAAFLFTTLSSYIVDSMTTKEISYNQFIALLENNNVESVVFNNNKIEITPKDNNGNIIKVRYWTTELNDPELIQELKEKLAKQIKTEDQTLQLVGDLVQPSDLIILVIPIDSAAPKGRLILPQQQTIRDILDADASAIVVKETELAGALASLGKKPKMVITDSQVFGRVSKDTPKDILLTSFSILFARYKGNLETMVHGVKALDILEDGDKVLISEGCTHHRQCDDIGTVKIPRWLKEYTGKELIIETSSGTEFPDDLGSYKMIIHCGGCMLNEREMKYRISCAQDQGIPIANYGMVIAYIHGILKRSLSPFPEIEKLL